MYRLKLKVIPSFKFIIGKDFIVQMFRESQKNLPQQHCSKRKRKNALIKPSKMSIKVSFVTPGIGYMGKMLEDFLSLPFIHSILANYIDFQCSAVQCSALHCSVIQYSEFQFSSGKCTAIHLGALHYNTHTNLHQSTFGSSCPLFKNILLVTRKNILPNKIVFTN